MYSSIPKPDDLLQQFYDELVNDENVLLGHKFTENDLLW